MNSSVVRPKISSPKQNIKMSAEESCQVASNEVAPIWNILESHGVSLPNYITRLLELTGYANLHSLSKLTDNSLIEELEHYTTENLEASDLGLLESEAKFFFSKQGKKFTILPGHKHLIYDAAETVQKVLQRAEEEIARDRQIEEENNHYAEADVNEKTAGLRGALHFLSEFASLSSIKSRAPRRKRDPNKPPPAIPISTATVEEEHQSLTEYLTTWIARKVLTGQLEPFILNVDYKINVFRPKTNGSGQPARPDIYSFVCLRCNTTIKAFKRSNGTNWNAANVCRHLAIVHCHQSLATPKTKKRFKDRGPFLPHQIPLANFSTPPLSDTPVEQDPSD